MRKLVASSCAANSGSLAAADSPVDYPRPGMLATIRNRRGLIAAVEPFDSHDGRLHLVRVEYTDSDGVAEDTVLFVGSGWATDTPETPWRG